MTPHSTPYPTRSLGRFYAIHAGIPLVFVGVLLILFETTNLDRSLSDVFYDPLQRKFSLREQWFLEVVMHEGAKFGVIAVAAVNLIGLIASFWRPTLRPWRRTFVYVLLCLGVCPGIVGWLKDTSQKHCPWDLEMYGGYAPYLKLFDAHIAGLKAGKCFPGGHASGGFAIMSTYFALLGYDRRWAFYGLAFGFTYGFVIGFVRIVQGAHFLSHNVASAFICWFAMLVLYEIVLRRADERRFGANAA